MLYILEVLERIVNVAWISQRNDSWRLDILTPMCPLRMSSSNLMSVIRHTTVQSFVTFSWNGGLFKHIWDAGLANTVKYLEEREVNAHKHTAVPSWVIATSCIQRFRKQERVRQSSITSVFLKGVRHTLHCSWNLNIWKTEPMKNLVQYVDYWERSYSSIQIYLSDSGSPYLTVLWGRRSSVQWWICRPAWPSYRAAAEQGAWQDSRRLLSPTGLSSPTGSDTLDSQTSDLTVTHHLKRDVTVLQSAHMTSYFTCATPFRDRGCDKNRAACFLEFTLSHCFQTCVGRLDVLIRFTRIINETYLDFVAEAHIEQHYTW